MPRVIPTQIQEEKLLLVEGRSAKEFFVACLRNIGRAGIQVEDFGGVDELRPFLKAITLTSGFASKVTSLGIVRDTEADAAGSFQSVSSALQSARLSVPAHPLSPEGTNPRVSILLLPDAVTPGMLETLCLRSVANDPVMQCVDQYVQCIRQVGASPNNIHKAQVQAYLASRPVPGLLLGQAAQRGYWNWNSPALDHVKTFLQNL